MNRTHHIAADVDVTVLPRPTGGAALVLTGRQFPGAAVGHARRTLMSAGVLEDPSTLRAPSVGHVSQVMLELPCPVAVGVQRGAVTVSAQIDAPANAALADALATLGATRA